MTTLLLVLFTLGFIEIKFSPRLDITKSKSLILWYNNKVERKYIKIL